MKTLNDTYDWVGGLALVDWVWVFGNGVEVVVLVARVCAAAELALVTIVVACVIFEDELAASGEWVAIETSTPFHMDSAAVEIVFTATDEVVLLESWWTVAVGGGPVRPAKADIRAQYKGWSLFDRRSSPVVDESPCDEGGRIKCKGTIAPDTVDTTTATAAKELTPLIFNRPQATTSISRYLEKSKWRKRKWMKGY